jgi:hypothetical protein
VVCREVHLQRFEDPPRRNCPSVGPAAVDDPLFHFPTPSVAWDIERRCARSSGRVCIHPNTGLDRAPVVTLERGASPHSDALKLPC